MNRTFTIRGRLTAWYFLFLALALGGGSLVAVTAMRHSINATVDEQLRDRGEGIRALILRMPPAKLGKEAGESVELQPALALLQISDSTTGQVIYHSTLMERLGVRPTLNQSRHAITAEFQGTPVRILSLAITANGHSYVVQVGEVMDEYFEAIERFQRRLLIGIPLLLVIATAGGYWISGRALRPVDEITRAAQQINPQDLSARVAEPRTGDELDRLAVTLNAMLQRIESAFVRVTQFTADASHELRTPIALIRTRAEIALRKERSASVYREALQEICSESERTSTLVQALMELARSDGGSESLRSERIDFAEAMSEAASRGRTLAQAKNIDWCDDIPTEAIPVVGDREALLRVALIVIDNAIKYTPEGAQVKLTVWKDSAQTGVDVQDTGIGIEEHDLPHIFDRFYRADRARSRDGGGAGLGLSIAHWIVGAHRGEINAERQPQGGSKFRFWIPSSPVV
jgi:heavy metal sensor kinase